MTVTMVINGDVAINASLRLLIVTVVTSHSVMMSRISATIAAPTPPAYRAEAMTRLSPVPEVRCWTSRLLVRTEDVTQITTQVRIWII